MTVAHDDPFLQAMDECFPVVQQAFTPRAVVPAADRDEAYQGRASAWASKALQGRADTLAAMPPDSGRNHYLSKSAWVLYSFALAGHLEPDNVTERMRYAAVDSGLGTGETEKTLESAWKGATRKGPLEPPVTNEHDAASEDEVFDAVKLEVDPITGEITEQLTPEQQAQRRHERQVAVELAQLRARDEAKTLYAAEKAAAAFREPPSTATLLEQLRQPRDPVRFSVEQVLPRGGNVLLTAQYKAGKTTTMLNLLRAYADDEPFLGRFAIHPHAGRIGFFNYELSQQQCDEWLESAGIKHPERVAVLHLRGYRLDLRAPSVEDWVVRWLREHNVATWIADPFARAAVGTDENSNTEVGQWLDTFDVIKERAGVVDGLLPVHTGRAEQEHGQERARGATRLDDWADARWILTRDEHGNRFFRATGRDVDFDEEKLEYDEASRMLTLAGGDRKWVARRMLEDAVVHFVRQHPGASQTMVEQGVEGQAVQLRAALRGAVAGHRVRAEDGPKNARLHWSNE